MAYTFRERQRIHRKAKRLLGLKQDAGDKREYMRVCIDEMMQDGEAGDHDEARDICEMLWSEIEDLNSED